MSTEEKSPARTTKQTDDFQITKKDCEIIVRSYLKRSSVEVLDWMLESASSRVLGFLGDYDNLTVVIKGQLPNTTCRLTYFVKTLPRNSKHKLREVQDSGIFRKESMLYYMLLPVLKGDRGPLSWRPRCYLVRNDALVLQDLGAIGYRHSSEATLNSLHCLQALKSLARMHAASIYFESCKAKATGSKCNIDFFYKEMLFETSFKDIPWCIEGFENAGEIARMSERYGQNTKYHNLVTQRLPDVLKQLWTLVDTSQKYRNVVCHRDVWNNNLMFKYDENGIPLHCVLVDYQLCRYCPPAVDFAALLYMNTRRGFREDNFQVLKANYYEELKHVLVMKGVAAEDCISQEEVDASFEEYRLVGLLLATMTLPLVKLPESFIRRILDDPTGECKSRTLVVDRMELDQEYREAVLEIVDELIEKYVI